MKLLLSTNETYDIDYIPTEIDDIRYCVLDYTDRHNPDYFFIPLMFLEIFNAPGAVLQIGESIVKIPIDWHVIICDDEGGDPEVIRISSLNDRGFKAFCLNPISGTIPEYHPIDIIDIIKDLKWNFPKLKNGHLLTVPHDNSPEPLCSFFVKDTTKIPDVMDISQLW